MTDRYNVTQKYLMTRGQAINFPAQYFSNFAKMKRNEVFGVVIDIPMSSDVLTTMVCFINGAANIYFNNGGEYTGAKGGVYKTEIKAGLIPEEEQELRTFYVLYQRVLSEIRSCQLKDEAEARKNAQNK